jgi:GT2 family glycosyltransferase
MFSILIPTWNNLEMLKLCVDSIRRHSQLGHQIVLHINDGSDGTLEWARSEGVVFTHSEVNIGICQAMNLAFGKATNDYILYLNDDMYVLPNWDVELLKAAQNIDSQLFMLSATMIEPRDPEAKYIFFKDFGRDVVSFQEEKLLSEYQNFKLENWSGSSWPPLLMSREAWLSVGGFSIEFSPGMYSDPDLAMKMWHLGCRIFKGVAASRVYHFQSRSTGRIVKNDGRRTFMEKWGIGASDFYKYYLRMGEPHTGKLPEVPPSVIRRLKWKTKLKLMAKFL